MGSGFLLLGFTPSMAWFLPCFVLVGTCNGYVPAAIALVDVRLPVHDRLELLHDMKARWSAVPVIMLQ